MAPTSLLPAKRPRRPKRRLKKPIRDFLWLIGILLALSALVVFWETRPVSDPEHFKKEFLQQMAPYALESYKTYGILPSITLAQAALESNWGRSELTEKYCNYFGIKSLDPKEPRVLLPTQEHSGGKAVVLPQAFRVYASPAESFAHHAKLLGRAKIYKKVLHETDYKKAALYLYEGGYATDPAYPQKLIALIGRYGLHLYDDPAYQFPKN